MNKPRPHLAKNEIRFHGRNSCFAIWKNRPNDVIRGYVHQDREEEYESLLRETYHARKAFQIVGDRDLEKLTDTTHHQGICIVAKEKKILTEPELIRELRDQRQLILYLDGVGNPHNLGAILRTAAHFGIQHVCLPRNSLPRISPSAHRTSEGAAEFVSVVHVSDPQHFFQSLQKRGFRVYGLDIAESAIPLYGTRLSEKTVFVMGAEVTGISSEILELVDTCIKIPGTDLIESLNVSVAAALSIGEFYRQGQEKSVRFVKKPTER